MTEGILFFSDFLTGALRIMVCLLLTECLLRADRRPSDKSMPEIFAGGLLGSFLITTVPAVSGVSAGLLYRAASEAAWIAVCSVRLRKADLRMSLFISTFYEIAVFFWQFLLAAGIGVLSGAETYLDAGSSGGQAAVWLFHLLLAAGAVVWRRSRNSHGNTYVGNTYRVASGITIAGFIITITLSEQKTIAIPEDSLTMWTILSVVLMMSVLVFHMNRQYEMERELAELKSGQAELLERDYTALSRAYAVNARLFHDFHNHIGVLRQMLSHAKTEEAVRYLDALQEPVRGMADTVWTGDETADYLINSKAASAKAQKISFHAQVEFPRNANIQSADLCAILGNLLDNALEAAGQTDTPDQRFVRLVIRRINQMMILKVENGFATAPIQEQGELRSTKTDGGLHGWGLKSVRTAAEKYDGTVQTACDGNLFRAVVTLSYR